MGRCGTIMRHGDVMMTQSDGTLWHDDGRQMAWCGMNDGMAHDDDLIVMIRNDDTTVACCIVPLSCHLGPPRATSCHVCATFVPCVSPRATSGHLGPPRATSCHVCHVQLCVTTGNRGQRRTGLQQSRAVRRATQGRQTHCVTRR